MPLLGFGAEDTVAFLSVGPGSLLRRSLRGVGVGLDSSDLLLNCLSGSDTQLLGFMATLSLMLLHLRTRPLGKPDLFTLKFGNELLLLASILLAGLLNTRIVTGIQRVRILQSGSLDSRDLRTDYGIRLVLHRREGGGLIGYNLLKRRNTLAGVCQLRVCQVRVLPQLWARVHDRGKLALERAIVLWSWRQHVWDRRRRRSHRHHLSKSQTTVPCSWGRLEGREPHCTTLRFG
jgi:hypothetical protein